MSAERNYLAVVRSRARSALAERLELLADVGVHDVVAAESPLEALREVRRSRRGRGVYVLDLDSVTLPVMLWARAQRLPLVLDLGDDAYTLARASGRRRIEALPRLLGDSVARRAVAAVVHRGRMHPVLRTLPARSIWCPDTVPDSVFELPLAAGAPDTIATFGSIGHPDPSGWTYGRELVDALEANRSLRGIVIGRGPGVAFFRSLARDLGLSERLRVLDEMPLQDLLEAISAARFVTSYQSNDRAGWVRTTGKLPLVLGSGRALLSTQVGEAAFVLPAAWLLPNEGRARFGPAVAARIADLGDTPASDPARELAAAYRRSVVAGRLGSFLDMLEQDL